MSTRRKSTADLFEQYNKKKAREAARKAAREANPKPYVPRADDDYTPGYYVDPLDNQAACKFRVPKSSLAQLGGLEKAGLVATPPAGKAEVIIGRLNKRVIFRVRWYFGNVTPVIVAETATHGRWARFADKTAGKYTHTLPFGMTSGASTDSTPTVDSLIKRFNTLFDVPAEKDKLLGKKGVILLEQGYGSKFIVIAKVRA